jgi:hypothetical protein
VADEHHVVEVQVLQQLCQVVGVGVEVVAVPRPGRATAAPAIVRDGTVAVVGHEFQLVVPGVGVQRRAVAEDDWTAAPPVLVEDLRAVRGGEGCHE